MNKIFALVAITALSLGAQVAHAKPISPELMAQVSDRSILKTGDYGWNDDETIYGPVSIRINLKTQMAYVLRGNTLIGITTISSGKTGFETPTGRFKILGKEDNHWSRKYKADMPWTMWVNNDGIALHSGRLPGYAASHGCVRLPDAFAEKLYQVVKTGTTVTVTNETARLDLDFFN